jgi:Na+/phosphate symporter
VLCGAVEYLTSFVLEKRFHARWWDYSTKPMNLHGRVWIGNLVLFGLGGVIIVKLTNPIFLGVFSSIIMPVKIAIAGGLTLIIAADYVVSHFVLKLVKTGVEKSEADNTEEINREIRTLLSDRSVFARRFAEAYPNVIYRTEKIAARMERIRKETERLKQNVEARLEEIGTQIDQKKTEIAYNIETSGSIKNRILEKQSRLIDILYDENKAPEDAKKLKKEIDSENIRLNRKWLQRGISSDSSDEN